jgi:hypothetical protein
MKLAQFVGYGLLISIGLSLFAAFFAGSLLENTVASLYELVGLGFMVFGTWGGVILIKLPKNNELSDKNV